MIYSNLLRDLVYAGLCLTMGCGSPSTVETLNYADSSLADSSSRLAAIEAVRLGEESFKGFREKFMANRDSSLAREVEDSTRMEVFEGRY